MAPTVTGAPGDTTASGDATVTGGGAAAVAAAGGNALFSTVPGFTRSSTRCASAACVHSSNTIPDPARYRFVMSSVPDSRSVSRTNAAE